MYRMLIQDGRVLPMVAIAVTAAAALEPVYRHYVSGDPPVVPSLSCNFHFTRRFPGESLQVALARHEHYLFAYLSPRRGMRILELGCGTGVRSRQLAHFSDAEVIGIDANFANVEMAREYTRDTCLARRVQFLQVSTEDLGAAFEANSFDAIFSVESVTTSPDFAAVCTQVGMLLKPGGKFAFYRWCTTDNYQPSLLGHRQVYTQMTASVSTSGRTLAIPSMRDVEAALRDQHKLSLFHSEDLARHQDRISWFGVLEESSVELAWAWWRQNDLVDPEFARVSILKAGKLRLFTPMALFVVQKDIH